MRGFKRLWYQPGRFPPTRRSPVACRHPYHGIDAGAAAKHMTEGHAEYTIAQSRRRFDREVVVERPADIVKPDTRVRDGRSVVGSSRLDDEYLRTGCGQFGAKNRTGRACSNHDVVISFFVVRYV